MDIKVVTLLITMNIIGKVVGGNDVDYSYSDGEGDDTSGDLPAWQIVLIVLGIIVLLLIYGCVRLFNMKAREERARKLLSEVVSQAVSKSYNQGVMDGQRIHTPQSRHQVTLNPKPRGNTSSNQAAQGPPPDYGSLQLPRPAAH